MLELSVRRLRAFGDSVLMCVGRELAMVRSKAGTVALLAILLLLLSPVLCAQSTDINSLQPHLVPKRQSFVDYENVGDQVDLYTGMLSVQQTDLTNPGIGPDIRIVRSFSGGGGQYSSENRIGEFADWSLDIPRIEGIVGVDSSSAPYWPTNRCSSFDQQSPKFINIGWTLEYNGVTHALVSATAAGLPAGTTAVSKDFWQISCLSSIQNGPGEGFVARSPDGLKIVFNYAKYRRSVDLNFCLMERPGPANTETTDGEYRYSAMMLATQVSDRFGNTLNYQYDNSGNLLSITSSDGRTVSFTYGTYTDNINQAIGAPTTYSLITSMTANGETWSYQYDEKTITFPNLSNVGTFEVPYLSAVTLPDGTNWSFDLSNIDDAWAISRWQSLNGRVSVTTSGSITSPAGATATFNVTTGVAGASNGVFANESARANVPFAGVYICGGRSPVPYVTVNPQIQKVTQKQLSGPGVNTQTWTYNRGSEIGWFSNNGTTSPTTNTVSITSPEGVVDTYIYSIMFDWTEGKTLEHDIYASGASTPSEKIAYTYTPGTVVGTTSALGLNSDALGREALVASVVDQKDGDSYTKVYQGYDSYNNPTGILRYNSFNPVHITESLGYLNDTTNWVLGLKTTDADNGTQKYAYSYSSLDEVTEEDAFGLRQTTYTYNSDGTLATVTDGDNHTTTLGSYYRGIPQSIGYPDGTNKKLTADAFGQVTSITDQAGHTAHYSYDSMERLARIDYPYDGSVDSAQRYPKIFTYAYVTGAERGIGAGHWRRTVNTGNAQTVTYFDAEMHPVLSDTSIAGVTGSDINTANAYDSQGHTTFTSYPVGGSPDWGSVTTGTHHGYDALGRLAQTQQDSELSTLTTTTQYLSGAGLKVTDPNGNVTTTYYQAFDQPAYDAPVQVQAPAGVTQNIQRDLFGAPTEITQSGTYGTESDSVSKYLYYDGYHRLCRTAEPESGSIVMALDAANNLTWSAQGQTITDGTCGQTDVASSAQTVRTYDAMNRVLSITSPSGTQNTVYTYDIVGNVSAVVSGPTAWSAIRNSQGQITQESLQVSGQNPWTIDYQFDAYANMNAIVYPNGESVGYAPDALGRATQVGSYASGISYFPNGQVAGFNFGNGASYVAEQNARQLLSNFSYGTGTALALSEDYIYDADGNITNVNDLVNGKRTKTFSYDALNRLTGATASNLYGAESYTYDPLNNLRSRLTTGTTLTFNYDAANRLTNVMQGGSVTTTYGYDAQGNRNSLTSGGATTQYLFDAANQLLQIPGLESYAYDASGRRVTKAHSNGASTYYFYNQPGHLLYQWDTAAGTSTNFIYLGTKLVAKNAQPSEANAGNTGMPVLFPPAYSITGSYTVSWYGISGASSYVLQSLVNGVWTTIYTGTANAYGIFGAANGVYQYRVQACANGNCGAWSATAEVTVNNQSTPATPALAPLLAINRSAAPLNYTVLWEGVANASTYNLQEQFQGGSWTTVYSGPNGSWDATNKPVGNYSYQVQACNGANCGPWSPPVSIKVSVDMSPIINLILDDN